MLNVVHSNQNPYLNMAIEEYLLTHLSQRENCFMLWQNRPAVIIGRHQNAWEDINTEYVREHDIAVVRRMTGGGAVYHDLGNLNFTFVVQDDGHGFDFARFSRPIIAALRQLGVTAEHSGRNDILIDGRKFSGNSEYRYADRLFHHGTLLFDSDLTVVGKALQVKPSKIASKGVKSVRSRVTNISEYLPQPVSLDEIKEALLAAVKADYGTDLHTHALGEADWEIINSIHEARYAQWEWTYGHTPEFNLQRQKRFPWGEVDIRLNIVKGMIETCTIYGDFFSNANIAALEIQLQGLRYQRDALATAMQEIDLTHFFNQLSREEFLDLLID